MATGIGRRRFTSSARRRGGGLAARSARAASGRQAPLGVLVGFAKGDDPESERWLKALLERLGQLGWRGDDDLEIDLRWGGMDLDQIKKSAKELVEARPDVIQVTTTPATAAILWETHTVPVVFAIVSDPVGSGFVQSLAHPGGNATGFVNIEGSIGTKWLNAQANRARHVARFGSVQSEHLRLNRFINLKSLEAAAPALALTVSAAHVSSAEGIKAAVADVARVAGGGLVIIPDIFTAVQAQRDLIISLAARQQILQFIILQHPSRPAAPYHTAWTIPIC